MVVNGIYEKFVSQVSEYRKEIPTKVKLPVQVLVKRSSIAENGVGLENMTSAEPTPEEESDTPPAQQKLLRTETAPYFIQTTHLPLRSPFILIARNYISGSASEYVRG